MKTDFDGLPIAFHLTGGEASDSRNFDTLLDIGTDPIAGCTVLSPGCTNCYAMRMAVRLQAMGMA